MTSYMHKERRLAIPFAPSIRYRGFTGKQFTLFFVEVIGSGYSNPPTLLLHYLYL